MPLPSKFQGNYTSSSSSGTPKRSPVPDGFLPILSSRERNVFLDLQIVKLARKKEHNKLVLVVPRSRQGAVLGDMSEICVQMCLS